MTRDAKEKKGLKWAAEEEEKFKAPIRQQYEKEGHPYFARYSSKVPLSACP